MQLRHLKNVLPATEGMCKVTAIAWAPNNKRLAVVTVERVVHLFDANTGERKDKFSTKPAEKGCKDYAVRGLAFSPDSTKLAIAQSDNIVFIYKIGLEWGDKKSICNKFQQRHSVTSITWPSSHPNEIVFGLADGKVKVGQLRTNKPATLYTTDSYTYCVASSPDGNGIVSSHVDFSIYRFVFDDPNAGGGPVHTKITVHSCIPYALSWGESIVAAGNDKIVSFYDEDGGVLKNFKYGNEANADEVGEFTVSTFNPSGDTVVVGNFNSFYIYNWNTQRNDWQEVGIKNIENLYSVSALAWKGDGSRLAIGNVCGALDLYDACVRRYRYKGKFEFTYVSISQVIVKRIANGERVVIKSQFGCEITKVNVFQDRFLIANTSNTILLGDLDTGKLSEVQWHSTGNEKYIFENESVCVVYQAGELSLIEYGQNEVLGSVRTEHMNSHLLSVRINERPPRVEIDDPNTPREDAKPGENKKIAYLLDSQTIHVKDLYTHAATTINHDCRVDWLELNSRANLALFRDKRRQLHMFDVDTQIRSTLLHYCNYVQWVPDSDVVVAQNRSSLYVWYNIRAPDQATIYQIKGDVEEIERANGKTEVIVDEGMHTASYQLDESLIAFGTAVDDRNLTKAMSILEPLELTPETEAMWQQLSQEALAHDDHRIAERCAAALGDVSRCRFLHKVNKIARQEGEDGTHHWSVRVRLSQLKGDFRHAEDIFVAQGQVDGAIEMYQTMQQWDQAIRVAEARNHEDCDSMKRNYYSYLIESRQEEKAALLKEREQDYLAAINLYLKGNLPARAAQLITEQNLSSNTSLLETVASALMDADMHDKAGEFFEKMGQEDRAMDAYMKAKAYRRAVELARSAFPHKVVELEEAWGDHLVSQKQIDMAINHYIEANVQTKAVEAALNSRQWAKASQLVTTLDESAGRPYYRRLARHYQDARQYEEAEKCFLKADSPQDAVEMYTSANKWDAAHKVAISYMGESEVSMLYISQAQRMEAKQKFKEAEKLYVTVNEPDLAINMYKKQRKYEHMIRLVTKFRKDLLKETHMHLAQQLEVEGNLRDSEHHYVEAGEWQAAVNMYRSNDQWDEAIRVAKYHGGINASKRVAYAWAMTLGGDAGSKLLTRLGLIEPAIDYAVESGAFDHAFELAKNCAPAKLSEVHFKHALYLEDEERFTEAEDEFIRAGKPREAVDMYIHQHEWDNAMRIAEQADPAAVAEIYLAQAKLLVESKDYARAEGLFVNAGKPDLALAAYQEAKLWQDAIRVAKRHLPHKLTEVNMAHQKAVTSGGKSNSKDDALSAGKMWENSKQYSQAIDAYLQISENQLDNPQELEEVWQNAVRVASSHVRGRFPEVAEDVARRLLGVRRFEGAADLFKDADKMSESIDCLIRIKSWKKALEYCQEFAPELKSRVEKARHATVIEEGTPDERQSIGDTDNAIDMWMQRGEWEKVLKAADEQGQNSLAKYLGLRCKTLCDRNEASLAVETMIDYTPPALASFISSMERVVKAVVGCGKDIHESPAYEQTVSKLFHILYKFMKDIKSPRTNIPADSYKVLDQLLLVVHFSCIQIEARNNDMLQLAAKMGMSLLRYIDLIAPDKLFYLAGMACRNATQLSPAFVYLNRYLDLSEAIEDGDSFMLDNSDFADTDIPSPEDFELPKNQYISDDAAREEIRDWVLALSMDQQIQESLPETECSKCDGSMYEASLLCTKCNFSYESCIVTGLPVNHSAIVNCTECNASADRESWNTWVRQVSTCPWCKAPQKMNY